MAALTITSPQAGGDAQVNTTNSNCCVGGNGAIRSGTAAVSVCAKIYQPPAGPTNPENGPPTDAVCDTPESDGKFNLGLVGGAAHNTGGTADNIVYVWADWGTGVTPRYTVESNDFNGVTTTSTPSCS